MMDGTGKSIPGNEIPSENSYYLVTHTEEEIDTEYEGMPATTEALVGETKAVQEAADEGEIKVDEVVGNFINRKKSYNIYFRLGFSYHMKR